MFVYLLACLFVYSPFLSEVNLFSSLLLFRAVGDKGQSEFEESLRKLFQALVQLMADVKNETLLTQVTLTFFLRDKGIPYTPAFLEGHMHCRKKRL